MSFFTLNMNDWQWGRSVKAAFLGGCASHAAMLLRLEQIGASMGNRQFK